MVGFAEWLEDIIEDISKPKNEPKERDETDPIPEVREPEPGTDFIPPNPDIVAKPREPRDIHSLLEEIATNTRPLHQRMLPPVWEPITKAIPANAGEISVQATQYNPYIYIPNVPRNMRIYSGQSFGLFLGSLSAGQTLQVALPYNTNGVFIEHDAGDETEFVTVYFSSKPIDIVINPAGAVWG